MQQEKLEKILPSNFQNRKTRKGIRFNSLIVVQLLEQPKTLSSLQWALELTAFFVHGFQNKHNKRKYA